MLAYTQNNVTMFYMVNNNFEKVAETDNVSATLYGGQYSGKNKHIVISFDASPYCLSGDVIGNVLEVEK